VQVSLDLTDIKEAMEMAHTAMRAGVDWLEAGTPFILAEGLHGVRALRREFPNFPVWLWHSTSCSISLVDSGPYLKTKLATSASKSPRCLVT
jgi:hypothetical protein